MNEGDQETSGTSFKRLRTSLKQRNQLLTLRLQNLLITEYKGKSFQVFPRCKGFHAVVHKILIIDAFDKHLRIKINDKNFE